MLIVRNNQHGIDKTAKEIGSSNGLLQRHLPFCLFARVSRDLFHHALATRPKRGPTAVLAFVLCVGRADVRVAHGGFHLLQLAVRLHYRKMR